MDNIDLTSLAQVIMLEKGFIPGFSQEILKETANALPPIIPLQDYHPYDLRHHLWFSLDNDDSRDLDQLTLAEELPNGKFKISIAVAHVDLLVKKHSAIDNRAAHNTTSVYTPTKIFPMLPERLSTDLTSLNPGEDRSAIIYEGILSSDGTLEDYTIVIGYVHNHAKLAYNSVSDWLEGNSPPPPPILKVPALAEQIRLQDKITRQLAENRHRHGALSLQTIETLPILANNVPIDIKATTPNRGRQLIENFMIIANTISAQFAQDRKIPSLRRVVVVPKRWDKIVEVAKKLEYTLPFDPDAIALEKFLQTQKKKNPDTFPDISLTIIKLLGRGEYRLQLPGSTAPGHFGLALRNYSHSTAPNRRFPDLITQRLLLAAMFHEEKMPYTSEELANLAERCTLKEDDADKIERRMKKSAAAMVLTKHIGQTFEGIITGAAEKGTWVRIFNPPVEGKVVKGAANLDVGDHVKVKLIHTDIREGFIDFVVA